MNLKCINSNFSTKLKVQWFNILSAFTSICSYEEIIPFTTKTTHHFQLDIPKMWDQEFVSGQWSYQINIGIISKNERILEMNFAEAIGV